MVEGTEDVTDATPSEKLAVSVRLDHTYIGDLVITVIPPRAAGCRNVVLHNRGRRSSCIRDRVLRHVVTRGRRMPVHAATARLVAPRSATRGPAVESP